MNEMNTQCCGNCNNGTDMGRSIYCLQDHGMVEESGQRKGLKSYFLDPNTPACRCYNESPTGAAIKFDEIPKTMGWTNRDVRSTDQDERRAAIYDIADFMLKG